jgi:glycerol kinase
VHATDVSNASRTMLWNIHEGAWDDELLELFRIPPSLLPEVRPSSGEFGTARQLGGIPIMGMAGDQQAAAFGQACWQPGMVKNTYGTGCFLLCNTGSQPVSSQHHLLSSAAWNLGSSPTTPMQYCLEGSVFMAGAIVQWLRDELGIISQANDVETLDCNPKRTFCLAKESCYSVLKKIKPV